MEINKELAKIDLDYCVRVYGIAVGKTLVTPKGDFEIVEVTPHLRKFVCAQNGKTFSFDLAVIAGNVNKGTCSIK